MKEYLVIFAQLLCVGWLLRTLSKAQGRLEDEQLGWFDIRLGSKPPKDARPAPPPAAGRPPAARSGKGKGPHA